MKINLSRILYLTTKINASDKPDIEYDDGYGTLERVTKITRVDGEGDGKEYACGVGRLRMRPGFT